MSKQKIEKTLKIEFDEDFGSVWHKIAKVINAHADSIDALNSLLPDVEKRCSKCKAPFEPHHHRHITRDGQFHTGCYKSDVGEKKAYYLGYGNNCDKCGKDYCFCPERQSDGSWKPQPPHTPVVEGWEEEFDSSYGKAVMGGIKISDSAYYLSIKSFISRLLTSARSEERQRIKEMKTFHFEIKMAENVTETNEFLLKDDVLAILNEK